MPVQLLGIFGEPDAEGVLDYRNVTNRYLRSILMLSAQEFIFPPIGFHLLYDKAMSSFLKSLLNFEILLT